MRTTLLPATLATAPPETSAPDITTPDTATPDTTTMSPTTVSTDGPTTVVEKTSPAPATLGPLLSITAQGDAVRVAADGSQTLLYDGPSPGSLLRLPGAGAPADTTVFGHSVALRDDETLVALGAIQIGTAELARLISLDVAAEGLVSDGAVIDDIVWIGDRRLAVVGSDTDGGWLRSFTVGSPVVGTFVWVGGARSVRGRVLAHRSVIGRGCGGPRWAAKARWK